MSSFVDSTVTLTDKKSKYVGQSETSLDTINSQKNGFTNGTFLLLGYIFNYP